MAIDDQNNGADETNPSLPLKKIGKKPAATPPFDSSLIENGKRLKALRVAKGLTQGALSELFKIKNGQAQISAYERGAISTGRHARMNYISILGANPDFIDHGTLPMFLPPDKQRKSTAEQLINIFAKPIGGNAQLVSPKLVGQWLNTGYVPGVDYPFIPGDCYIFPVLSANMGPDFPPGTYMICTRLDSPSGLLEGRPYVFQTENELLVRFYAGVDKKTVEYQLRDYANTIQTVPVADMVWLYHIERIDRPVL